MGSDLAGSELAGSAGAGFVVSVSVAVAVPGSGLAAVSAAKQVALPTDRPMARAIAASVTIDGGRCLCNTVMVVSPGLILQ